MNRPFASCLMPLFESEAKCEAIDMYMMFHSHANNLVFQPRLESESFWNSEMDY